MSPEAEIRRQAIAARAAELLSVKEFSAVVRVHPLTVYRWIREGKLRGVCRFGKEIRIDVVVAEGSSRASNCPPPP